ncbi:MAG: lysozyme inhibitor LprI family protein [Desulfobacterales bacterium]|nr:lysozyme inhibitor LprI family protein [Desulfobacterales bacterium]
MNRLFTAIACLIFLSSTSVAFPGEPSFDCAKASNSAERSICGSDRLSRLDVELSRLYKNVINQLPPDEAALLKSEQLDWLKDRNRRCNQNGHEAETCLAEIYRQRNEELAAMLVFDSSAVPAGEELKVLRIIPKGDDVLPGRQIVFQFDRPVVPIGRMERSSAEIPVTVTPALACEWRWLNTSALACQLREEDQMKPATRYEVVMAPGITTEHGARLKETVTHGFITARPKVRFQRFVNWLSPGTPLIQITFNQPVTKKSVEATLTMTARRAKQSAPVGVVAFPDDMPRELPWWLAMAEEEEQPGVDDRFTRVGEDKARRIWVVEPRQELPLDETIWLDIAPGLVSSEGPETGAERRALVSFETYPKFEFLGLRCMPKGEKRPRDFSLAELRESQEEEGLQDRCVPLNPIGLIFSAPVMNSQVRDHVSFSPRLDGERTDYDPWENRGDFSRLGYPHRTGRHYHVWLPASLQADQRYSVGFDVAQLQDEFGRRLTGPVDFSFVSSHREPKLVLDHNFAVLEKGADSDVPLYVTNLNSVRVTYDKLGSSQVLAGLSKTVEVQGAEDIAYAMPLGVRELLGDSSGILYGYLHPDPTPPNWYRDPAVLAQVTPYQVHFKLGHFNSQVWVTDFESGLPVAGAKVSLLKGDYGHLPGLQEIGHEATTDHDGLAKLAGLADFDPDLKFVNGGYREEQPGLFAKVEADEDIAVLPLNGSFAVRGGGTHPRLQKRGGHTRSWGTTAQGIYKLGDTVEYKIYVREQSNQHWIPPRREGYELQVVDPQGKIVHEVQDITLNEFGACDGRFKVPEQGAVGWYRFRLMPSKASGEKKYRFTWTPMSVLISDFTPAPFKVKTELNGDLFKAKDQVEVTSLATLHSGGPFSAADIRLTAKLAQKPFTTSNPLAKGFTFGSISGSYLNREQSRLLDVRGKLDDTGQYVDAFTLPETGIYFGSVTVEAAVRDDRGKFVAATAKADYAGRDRFVGLRNTRWLYKKGQAAKVEALVVNQASEPVPGVAVTLVVNHREYKAARVKGPGNAYLTKNIMEWVEETRCSLQSAKGSQACQFTPRHPGYYQFVATIKDSQGREHQTRIYGWVTGRGSVVWDQTDDATLQIIAEQSRYKIGDSARYLIKNPFPGAKALVTVERYGVLDSWVEALSTSTPIIEVPIKPDYLPGFYLSVAVVSPRVAEPLGPGLVDLGKPSYRMGYVRVPVTDPYKEIGVTVTTDRDVYKPRSKVKAVIRIDSGKLGGRPDCEIAVAVVDESVLALNRSGKGYYDPYAGFNHLDGLDVNTYSLISRLVGRQKFEKKGADPGGGGGSAYSQLRNLFKYVGYWNPSIRPDSGGRAEIEFSVPDNLTGWRILALAVTPDDHMGLGDSGFKVNRPTEIRPVMPNQLIEGDAFKAGFNVMNRTGRERRLKMEVGVSGPLAKGSKRAFSYDMKIAPYQRTNIWLPLITEGSGDLKFVAEGGDAADADAIEHTVSVHKRRSLETAANYGTTTAASVNESMKVPAGAHADIGAIEAVLSPTVIGNVSGAFRYVKEYPYLCWEQRLTKAVMAKAYVQLDPYLDATTQWPDPGGDITGTLGAAANFQAPNGGMAYWIPTNDYVSSYLSAYTALAFNWLKKAGHRVPERVESRLHHYLLNLLRRDEFPTFFSQGMASSVRAVALAALAEAGKVSAEDVERHASHMPEMDLFGKSHFLQAAIKTAEVPQSTIRTTIDAILGAASQSGGRFQFNEPWDDSYKYILATPMRSNCTVLSSLLRAQTELGQGAAVGDIPFKLVRSISQGRGNRDHWENTQENLFCTNALVDYAAIYEHDKPDMRVAVQLDDEPMGEATFTAKSDPQVTVSRPIRAGDPGRSAKLHIAKKGPGRLYYAARMAYALKEGAADRINAGIEIRREYSVERDGKFVLLESPMKITRGELVKVDLFVSVPTARHFVVVHDSLPGGLEPVNSDLATSSQVDADKARDQMAEGSWFFHLSDWSYFGRYFWSFYHKELRHDSARFYADYLPAGNYRLSYTAQAIAEGHFSVMPVHVEEMYNPDVFGKGLPATLIVAE